MAGSERQRLKVFISYSRRDALDFADQLFAALQAYGFDPALDRHGISGAEDWEARLGALILEADSVAFVLSPESARSPVCAWEVSEARRLGKRIVPVAAAPLQGAEVPEHLRRLNYIFFYPEPSKPGSGFGAGLADLVRALNTDVDWLREHTRLLTRAMEWLSGGRPRNRLLSGKDIQDAKDWAARRPKDAPEPAPLHFEFIRESEEDEVRRSDAARRELEERTKALAAMEAAQQDRERAVAEKEAEQRAREEAQRAHEREQKKRTRLQRVLTAGAVVAALAFGGFAAVLIRQNAHLAQQTAEANAAKAEAVEATQRAEAQTKIAEAKSKEAEAALIDTAEAKQIADEELRKAQLAQSRFLKIKAEEALGRQGYESAALLAMEGLPDKTEGVERPVLEGLPQVLFDAVAKLDGNVPETRAEAGQALIDFAKQKVMRCLTEQQRAEYALDENEPVWCDEMSKWPYKPRRWGVTLATDEIIPELSQIFPRVSYVARYSPAEKAGLRARDQILSINGVNLPSADRFMEELDKISAGGSARVEIDRKGKTMEFVMSPRD